MKFLKGVAYLLAAILLTGLVVAGVSLIAAIMAFGGTILLIIGGVILIAFCIKEIFENAGRNPPSR